jgi:hypothetical protein
LIGTKFAIGRQAKRNINILHQDVALVTTARFDDTGANLSCKVLFTGQTARVLKQVINDASPSVSGGSVKFSMPVQIERVDAGNKSLPTVTL